MHKYAAQWNHLKPVVACSCVCQIVPSMLYNDCIFTLFDLQCNSCKSPPVGDYFEYKKVHFCRKCYNHHLTTGEKYTKR